MQKQANNSSDSSKNDQNIDNIDHDVAALIEISRFAGERFDLVQAGGGNTSVKLADGRLIVKASGMPLSDVSSLDHFCLLDWQPLVEFLNQADPSSAIKALEAQADVAVTAARLPQSAALRPSIEALLHCLLGRFTLHTHPIAVATVVCRQGWQQHLQNLFKTELAIYEKSLYLVPYKTPGPALALALNQQLKERNFCSGDLAIIFLQNHGLIVAAPTKQLVMQVTNEITDALALALPYNLFRYKLVNFASALVNQVCSTNLLAYLSDDQILLTELKDDIENLLLDCATPDQLVYCGTTPLPIDNLDSPEAVEQVQDYLHNFGHPPKVLIVGGEHIILLGQSLRKCREVEEVLKAHVILNQSGPAESMQFLESSEIEYLNNCEAEKYRQKL